MKTANHFSPRHGRKAAQRQAAVLVCVLIVLLVTGTMAVQGTTLLLAISRSATAHVRLEQTHELLALGRARLSQQLKQDTQYSGETLNVVIAGADNANANANQTAEAPANVDGTNTEAGEIRIERLDDAESGNRWRIVASAPLNRPGTVTATWETNNEN